MMIYELLKRVCMTLEKHRIPYMVSGSIALNIYTVPRMTRDIDIVVVLKKEDIDRFLMDFTPGFYHHRPSIVEEIEREGMFNLIDNQSGYKIDFIVRKSTEYRKAEFDRKIQTDDLGFNVWTVAVEDLILSKLIWIQEYQSDRQMSDIRSLLENPAIDFQYLKHWREKLELNTFGLIVSP